MIAIGMTETRVGVGSAFISLRVRRPWELAPHDGGPGSSLRLSNRGTLPVKRREPDRYAV